MKNYYQIIGVDSDASEETIKRAYLLKVKKYHPDVYTGDKAFAMQKTAELNEAYEVLKDETKRAEYNKTIKLNEPPKQTLKDRWQQYKQRLNEWRKVLHMETGNSTKEKKQKPKLTKEQEQEKNDKKKLTSLIIVTLVAILVIVLLLTL